VEGDDGFIVTKGADRVGDSKPGAFRVDPGDGLAAQLLGFSLGPEVWIIDGALLLLCDSGTFEVIEDQLETPEWRDESLLVFSMDDNERQANPTGKDREACQRISFNASLDEECERDEDNDRAADRNPNPVHALLEPEEIGKPGVLTLHFVEDIRDRRSVSFRGAAK
jgi:hypothetical protein